MVNKTPFTAYSIDRFEEYISTLETIFRENTRAYINNYKVSTNIIIRRKPTKNVLGITYPNN